MSFIFVSYLGDANGAARADACRHRPDRNAPDCAVPHFRFIMTTISDAPGRWWRLGQKPKPVDEKEIMAVLGRPQLEWHRLVIIS